MTNNPYHIPVLLNAAVEGLDIDPQGIYVDVTFGGGGHSRAILEKLDGGKLIAFDQDPDARENLPEDDRLVFVPANFRFLKNYLRLHRALPVKGVLADLGVSSHQFDTAERGFSLRFDGPLDMRMNPGAGATAADVLNTYEVQPLTDVLRKYGELKAAYRIATTLVKRRSEQPIRTINELREILTPFRPNHKEHQFLAKVFQALRIEVNRELEALEEFLLQTPDVLAPGGRLVVISYHSLEDRLVKNFMKKGKFTGEVDKDFYGNQLKPFQTVNGKAIVPDPDEIDRNSRARSARLRIAEREA